MPEALLSSPILNTLALTLLHFLWQGLIVAGVLKIVLALISTKSANARYAATSTAMLANFVLPIITFFWLVKNYSVTDNALAFTQSFSPLANSSSNLAGNDQWLSLLFNQLPNYLPYIALAWVVTVVLLTLKLIVQLCRVQVLPYSHTVPTPNALQQTFEQLVAQLNISRKPQLVLSLKAQVPMALGWLKPVVLLPAHMMTGLTPAQLEMLLLHELGHIRRYDYLVNFLQSVVEILLFFHPAVNWVSKQMRQEREYCTDDIAVAHCHDAVAYAHTLADTAELCDKHHHATIPTMAMAASGGDLKQRVVRLVNHECTNTNEASKWLAGATVGLVFVLVALQQLIMSTSVTVTMSELGLFNLATDSNKAAKSKNQDNVEQLNETTIAQQLLVEPTSAEPTRQLITEIRTQADEQLQAENIQLVAAKAKASSQHSQPNSQSDLFTETTNSAMEHVIAQADTQSITQPITQPTFQSTIKNTETHEDPIAQFDIDNKANLEQQLNANTYRVEEVAATFNRQTTDSRQINYQQEINALANELINAKSTEDVVNLLASSTPALGEAYAETNNNSISLEQQQPYFTQMPYPSPALSTRNYEQQFYQSVTAANLTNSDDEYKYSAEKDVIELISAELIKVSEPKYPSIAKRKGIEVDVEVSFTVDKDGFVRDISFESRAKVSYFRGAITSAMKKWRFLPAQQNGEPVESQMSKIFSFSLT